MNKAWPATLFPALLFLAVAVFPGAAPAFQEFQYLHRNLPFIPGPAAPEDYFGSGLGRGDFNGDGYADLAVGVQGEDIDGEANAGGVYVLYGSPGGMRDTGVQHWDQGVAPHVDLLESNDFFGGVLAAGDFNGDGFADLAVGTPNESLSTIPSMGSVSVFYGSPSGLVAAGRHSFIQYTSPREGDNFHEAGDYFGVALAAADFNGDGYADLAVGASGEDIGSVENAGAVNVLYGAPSGLGFAADAGNQFWHQDVSGMEDTAEAGDRFGSVLTAGDFNADGYADLAVGAWSEDIGSIEGAGATHVLYGSSTGLTTQGDQFWHQDVAGILDQAETNDNFGISLDAGDYNGDGFVDLAIGAKSEDINGVTCAGAVHVLYGSATGLTTQGDQFWHQDVSGISAKANDFDFYGSALASGDFDGNGCDDLAVGFPDGEYMVGIVNVLFGSLSGLSSTGNELWHQNSDGVHDSHEPDDMFGNHLTAGDFDGDGVSDLAASALFESLENGSTTKDAGVVHVLLSGMTRLVFPHVDAKGAWQTEVCVVNHSGSSLSGTFVAYKWNGDRVGSAREETLAAHARTALDVASTFSNAAAIKYVTFVHDGDADDVTGYTKFTTPGQYRSALPASLTPASGDLHISHIASTSSWWTGIGLVNLTGLNKTLPVRFSTGQVKTIILPPHGQTAFLVQGLFGGMPQPAIASAVIENAAGVVGLELFSQGNQLGGIRLSDETAPTLYFPHIHSDASWWTGLAVYNPHATSTTLTVTPYSAAGTPLGGRSIPVGGKSKYVGLASQLSLPQETAWVKIGASRAVTGFELFGTSDEKILAGFTAVGLPTFNGVFPKIDPSGWTGIALVNTTSAARSVTLTAYADSGSQVATTTVPLSGYGKTLGYVEDLFAGSDISSATYVAFSATGPVAGFQLNGSADGWLLDGLPGM